MRADSPGVIMPRQPHLLLAAILSIVLVWFALSAPALADGKAFPPTTAPAAVQTADQRAAIWWRDGRERLVIDTTLRTGEESVAWVVPVPSRPTIQPATKGFFPTLQSLFEPRLVEGIPRAPFMIPVLILALGLIIHPNIEARTDGIALLVVWLLAGFVFLPTLNKAGSSTASRSLRVHERQVVGDYETVTIEAADPAELIAWLNERGYHVPGEAEPVIGDYIERGWLFVAARLQKPSDAGEDFSPHPLRLDFAADRCVYPMRLTGVEQDEPITLELFVFSDAQATSDRLDNHATLRGELQPTNAKPHDWRLWPPVGEVLPVAHPYLKQFIDLDASGRCIATHLHGTLQPEDMDEDIELTFTESSVGRGSVYTTGAAYGRGILVAFLLIAAGLFIACVAYRWRPSSPVWQAVVVAAMLVGVASGGIAAWSFPRAETGGSSDDRWRPYETGDALSIVLTNAFEEQQPERVDADWVRETIDRRWTELGGRVPKPRELDAPGHFTIEEDGQRVTVYVYGYTGNRHTVWRWSPEDGAEGVAP